MRNLLKSVLLIALTLSTMPLLAQPKMAIINTQELISVMPETAQMQANLTALQSDLQNTSETMQVEWNTKLADYQANSSTMTESVRNLREKDLQDLRTRISEFEQNAMQELQQKQQQLLEPIIAKAREAIDAEAKAQSIAVVFDNSAGVGAVIYSDSEQVVDILSAVKTRLGIAQ